MNPETKSRLDALMSPASKPLAVGTPLEDYEPQLQLAKVIDFAGEISVVVDQVKSLVTDSADLVRDFKKDTPALITQAARQGVQAIQSNYKATETALDNNSEEIALMRSCISELHGTIKVTVGICFVLWMTTVLVIFLAR